MVYRNDNIQTVQAQCVYENDVFEYELGLEPKLVHKPALKDRGELILVYALWKSGLITENGLMGIWFFYSQRKRMKHLLFQLNSEMHLCN